MAWPHLWPSTASDYVETVLTRASESIVFGLKSTTKSTKVVKKRWRICSGTGDRGFESRRFDQKDRFWRSFFHSVEAGEDKNPPRAPRFVFTHFVAAICSHYLRAWIGFAFQVKPRGARSPKANGRNIHLRRKSRRHTFFRGSTSWTLTPRGSPTARKYSRRLSPSQAFGSAVSLFSSGASP